MRGARMLAPCVEVFPILGKRSAAIEPGDGALDNPTAGKHHESFGVIGALDDFSFELRQGNSPSSTTSSAKPSPA